MTDKREQSQQRRTENEMVFKYQNERIERHTNGLLDADSRLELLIGFVCECSNEECRDKIQMPVARFRKLRKNIKQFIIKPGHERTDIERVVRTGAGYEVVEKYQLPPALASHLNAT